MMLRIILLPSLTEGKNRSNINTNMDIFNCKCIDRYTVEDNILYYGRCDHKHGFNLCTVSDVSYNMLDILNGAATDDTCIRCNGSGLVGAPQIPGGLSVIGTGPCPLCHGSGHSHVLGI